MVTSATSRVNGRAPYLRMLASSRASSTVNCPVICAWPPRIAASNRGADCTRPSSTMANWFCGALSVTSRPETSASCPAPSSSKVRSTCQPPPPWVGKLACASVTFVPRMKAGSSKYLAVPSRSQVTSHLVGSSGRPPCVFSGKVQSNDTRAACRTGSSRPVPATGASSVNAGSGAAGSVDTCGVGATMFCTGRKSSRAVCLI